MAESSSEPQGHGGSRVLSGEESTEFARQVAGLARAGLPLPQGLRALGEEVDGPLRGMLKTVAEKVEKGVSLEEAVAEEGSRFPAPLKGLIAAGVRSGHLAEALGRFLELEELAGSLRRKLLIGLVYPTLLMMVAFALFVAISMSVSNGIGELFADFGIAVPWITMQVLEVTKAIDAAGWWLAAGPLVAVVVVWIAMRLTLGPAERRRVVQGLPLIGPLARETALAQFCPILALLLESDVPLPEALRLAGEASRDASMEEAAGTMAAKVESGSSLAEAIRDQPPFPRGFDKLLAWAEESRGLIEALRLSAETFESHAKARAVFLSRFCNAATMGVVLWWVGLTVLALFLPMVNLLGMLGGGVGGGGGWLQATGVAGISLVTLAGLVVVIILAWRLFEKRPSLLPPAQNRAEPSHPRARFWYFGSMGWTLVGLAVVMLLAGRAMLWLDQSLLPSWWTDLIWPRVQLVGLGVVAVGVLTLLFATVASQRRGELSHDSDSLPRVRISGPRWRFGLRHLMFAMAPLALGFVVIRDFGAAFPALLLMLGPPVALAGGFVAMTSLRALRKDALLQVLAIAARQGQPLGPAVEAFAESCRGRERRESSRLAWLLSRGEPLPSALDQVPRALSKSSEVVARVGWETGTLHRALDDAVVTSAAEKTARSAMMGTFAYPLLVFSTICGVGGFMLLFISPALARTFEDFGVPLPEPSRSVFHFVHVLWSDILPGRIEHGLPFILLFVAVCFFVGLLIVQVVRFIVSWTRLGDRFVARRHAAVVLRALAAGMEADQPIPMTLDLMAKGHPRAWVRRRLSRAQTRIERGEPWWDALARETLIGPAESALLASAERVGNLPWAMREAALGGERRLSYRIAALGHVVRPLVLGAMGLLVLLFAITYFSPLIALIDALSRI